MYKCFILIGWNLVLVIVPLIFNIETCKKWIKINLRSNAKISIYLLAMLAVYKLLMMCGNKRWLDRAKRKPVIVSTIYIWCTSYYMIRNKYDIQWGFFFNYQLQLSWLVSVYNSKSMDFSIHIFLWGSTGFAESKKYIHRS